MSGLRVHMEHGPETYLANEDMMGGVFVEPVDATSTIQKVKRATAGSRRVLGLCIGDAAAVVGTTAETMDAWNRPTQGVLKPPNEIAVAYRGSWWLWNNSAARIEFGDHVKAAANGAFVKWVDGTDGADLKLAKCIEVGGVAIGAEGKFRLLLG